MAQLIHTHSRVFAAEILDSGSSCTRCGWCCRENFSITITKELQRPSNAISLFPDDIRHIMKGTGLKWDKIAQPDIYSCLSDREGILAIGWILKRNIAGNCVFYRDRTCKIYQFRPMICRCYPFFMGEMGMEIMHCEGSGNKISKSMSEDMGRMLKRYEIKKLSNYIKIIDQIKDRLNLNNLHALPQDYSGPIVICDGESISRRVIREEHHGIARI